MFFLFSFLACLTTQEDNSQKEYTCNPDQPWPYPSQSSYTGIHGNASNNDFIPCETAASFTEAWHSLKGRAIPQPSTFSPDGSVTYATTTSPDIDGCRLHALDTTTGETLWCQSAEQEISNSAVEVDIDGNLFFTSGATISSLNSTGKERWSLEISSDLEAQQNWGLHLTPDGHIATVNQSGLVLLINRHTGTILDTFSIPDTYGFVAPASIDMGIDFTTLLPESVQDNIKTIYGEPTGEDSSSSFGSFLGADGFVDNTLGISDDGDIYVIGGGLDEQNGALVQIRVSGPVDAPKMEAGWYTPTNAGSASSPSISPGGQYVVIADGSSMTTFINPEAVEAHVKVMDIHACDANTDSNPDPLICAVSYQQQVERGPMIGAPAILQDGTVIFWEIGLDFTASEHDRDLIAFDSNGIKWSAALPNNRDWTSVITVSENHLIGTATSVELSDSSLLSLRLPKTTDNALVIVDRFTGELLWEHPITDDSVSTVNIGPDGSLYVALLGTLTVISTEQTPTLGLIKFTPK